MLFNTGISIHQESDSTLYVAATTWFSVTKPTFSVRGFTLPHAKENLLAVVVIRNPNQTQAVNAACHRTIESLIVHNHLPPKDAPNIELLVRPYLSREHFMLRCKRTPNHWLLNAADAVLNSWLRGER